MASAQVLFQYLTPGSHTVTVPAGFSNQLLVYAWGAGGGAGSQTGGFNGQRGGGGGFAQGIVNVDAGDRITISVGAHGQNGPGGTGRSSRGGDSTNPIINLSGGNAGASNASNSGKGGPGGGGGAASSILVNGIPQLVAAGGGGAGGGGGNQKGSVGFGGGIASSLSSIPKGASSSTSWATGGGAGGGYPKGGAAGRSTASSGSPTGGYGGQNYADSGVGTSSLSNGSGNRPGGLSSPFYPGNNRAYGGYDGSVIVVFSKNFKTFIKDTTWKEVTEGFVKDNGGWKSITAGFIKTDGEWKPIQSGGGLNPEPTPDRPSQRAQVNLTIAADTNNYEVRNFLAATNYYPGYSNVTITVNSGVTVSSTAVGNPALRINGLSSGDIVWLVNQGTIQGRGGDGGTGGSYTVTPGGPQYDSKGRPIYGGSKGSTPGGSVTSVPGRPGAPGGSALRVDYPTKLVNTNLIAGGGGGGGGGGGDTGGDGGGGAGVSRGANNGTMTSPGAGAGKGGSGGDKGQVGYNGTNDTNPGGRGGAAGISIFGASKIQYITTGSIRGPKQG